MLELPCQVLDLPSSPRCGSSKGSMVSSESLVRSKGVCAAQKRCSPSVQRDIRVDCRTVVRMMENNELVGDG